MKVCFSFNGQTPCHLHPTLDTTATEQPVQKIDDQLPREPCLLALAALRHAKWFQVCFSFFLFVFRGTNKKKNI